jgi:hypothetical protein
MIPILVAVGKKIFRADVTMAEHKCMCEDLAHMCNEVDQVYGIPMGVTLSG